MGAFSILILGAVTSGLFRFRNTDVKYRNPISLLILTVYAVEIALLYLESNLAIVLWGVVSSTLVAFYAFRFTIRRKFQVLDFLKLLSIILIALHPIILFAHEYWFPNNYIQVRIFGQMINPIVFSIIIYDRLIHNSNKMKKTFRIVLVAQTVLILLLLLYGFQQKSEADRQRDLAVGMHIEAQKQSENYIKERDEKEKLIHDLENCR